MKMGKISRYSLLLRHQGRVCVQADCAANDRTNHMVEVLEQTEM